MGFLGSIGKSFEAPKKRHKERTHLLLCMMLYEDVILGCCTMFFHKITKREIKQLRRNFSTLDFFFKKTMPPVTT